MSKASSLLICLLDKIVKQISREKFGNSSDQTDEFIDKLKLDDKVELFPKALTCAAHRILVLARSQRSID